VEDDGAEGIADLVGDACREEQGGFELGLALLDAREKEILGNVAEKEEEGGLGFGVCAGNRVGGRQGHDLGLELQRTRIMDGNLEREIGGEVCLGNGVVQGRVAEAVGQRPSRGFVRRDTNEVEDAGVGKQDGLVA